MKDADSFTRRHSPLGAGFLGNNWKSKDDLPEGDMRRNFDKFSDEHFEHNMQLVRKLTSVAEKKGVTPAQLSIAWVRAQSVVPLPGSVRPPLPPLSSSPPHSLSACRGRRSRLDRSTSALPRRAAHACPSFLC